MGGAQDTKYPVVEYAALLLCNLTQKEDVCRVFLQRNGTPLSIVVDALVSRSRDVAADALAFVVMNVTRERGVAAYMYRRSQSYFPRLLTLLTHPHPSRRLGICSALRNVCLLEAAHRELIDTDVVTQLALIVLTPLERLTAKVRRSGRGGRGWVWSRASCLDACTFTWGDSFACVRFLRCGVVLGLRFLSVGVPAFAHGMDRTIQRLEARGQCESAAASPGSSDPH